MISLRDQGVTLNAQVNDAGDAVSYTLSLHGDAAEKFKVTSNGADFTISDAEGNDLLTVTADGITAAAGNKGQSYSSAIIATDITAAQSTAAQAKYYDKDGNAISENALEKYFTTNKDGDVEVRADAPKLYDAVGNEVATPNKDFVTALQDKTAALTLTLHVGADATSNNQITLSIDAMSAKGLGVNGLKVDGTDDTNALSAIDTIKEAIQKVSTQRSALGAVQNRLEHTINNLDNVVENTTSAESQIRDTDMATEMVKYSNNNILSQAGQAMLAQANQSNQGVLSLLQ